MGVPLLPPRILSFLRPSPPPPPGRSHAYLSQARVLGVKQMGSAPVTRSLPSTVPRVGVTTIWSPVPRRVRPSPRLSYSSHSSQEKNWQEILKSKLDDFNGLKNTVKPYLGKAFKESVNQLKQVLEKILLTVQQLGQLVFHHVVMGLKAKVSEYSWYFFMLGVIGIIGWIAHVFNLMWGTNTEDHTLELEELERRVRDLLKEFPLKMTLFMIYVEMSLKMLREVILIRKQQAEVWKMFETQNQRINEVENENRMLKADFLESEMKLREVTSQAQDLKEALTKLKDSAESS